MSTQSTNRKLPMKVKVLFPLAQAAPTVQVLIQMYFLVYFHTNILGIPAAASGTIILRYDHPNRACVGLHQRPADGNSR